MDERIIHRILFEVISEVDVIMTKMNVSLKSFMQAILTMISSTVIRGLLMPIAGMFLLYVFVQEEVTVVINQPIFGQPGISSNSVLLNKTNMTSQIAPTITGNPTITPAPEVNETLIGRSTPTTSNTTLQIDNKTGEAEPLGGIK
jgi:hypothetical protein